MKQNTNRNIAIITLHGYYNYGNRLQNYALQEIIKELGFHVETIVFQGVPLEKYENGADKHFNLSCADISRKVFNKINKKIINYANRQLENTRKNVFKIFSDKYIIERFYNYSNDSLKDLSGNYCFFIVGSDQVWKPVNKKKMPIYFLTFCENNKRISYAPSFGISKLPSECKEDYKLWLSEIHQLSVREDDGAKIIKELTGRDAPVLVDPTVLLTKEKWLSIAKEASNKPKGKYLLTYFLGGIPDNYKKQIKNIVTENKLEVINLGDIREKETYRTGPSEFIDYINDCSIFCTDSFHGAVFSILLEKPFIVFERIGSASMYSRIDTLLNKFELNDRKAENMSWGEDVFDVDFLHIPTILAAERKKSMDYLKDALNIKDV